VENLREIELREFVDLSAGLKALPEDYQRTILTDHGLDFRKLKRGLKQDIDPANAPLPGSREYLQMELDMALRTERYEVAARLRDRLTLLGGADGSVRR
jgi:hypothetical protein